MSDSAQHVRVQLEWVEQLPADAPVPSPCRDVCSIDAVTGFCDGCLRTLDEIGAWGSLPDKYKREVWRELGARADALDPQVGKQGPAQGGDALTPTLSQRERE